MAAGDSSGGAGGGTYGAGGLSDTQSQSGQQSSGNIQQAIKNLAGSSGGVGATGYSGIPYVYGGSQQATAQNFLGSPAANPKNPSIYMGTSKDSPFLYLNYSDAVNMYYQWDAATKNKFLSQLSLAGWDTNRMQDGDLASTWAKYVTAAASYQAAGTHISPWDIIGKDIAQRSNENAQPTTVTQTQQRYNISTKEEAAALFQGAAQTLLGRDPTQSEQARFQQILNKYERAHPTTMTTTTDYIGGNIKSSRTKDIEGGVTAGAQQYIAQQEAKKNPEYGAYQAATSGMNWLLEMVKGT